MTARLLIPATKAARHGKEAHSLAFSSQVAELRAEGSREKKDGAREGTKDDKEG